MNTYNFKHRRHNAFFLFRGWKTEKDLIGHKWFPDQNKMVLYYKTGAVKEIAQWHMCEVQLGTDWVLFNKNQMEKEAGQPVKLAVEPEGR
jgi:hypothetical protein